MSIYPLRPWLQTRPRRASPQRLPLLEGWGRVGRLTCAMTLLGATACDNPGVAPVLDISAAPSSNAIPTNNTSTLEVRIRTPVDGASVSGTVAIEVEIKERDVQRARGEIFIGQQLVASSTAERFTYSWNTDGYTGSQTITAVGWDVQGRSAVASITVTAPSSGGEESPPPSEPTAQSIALDPDTVVAGQTATGTVTLDVSAPAGGAVVSLVSNRTAVATVPPSVTVPEGQTSATFAVSSQPVASTDWAAISANAGGVTRTATLWVVPAGVTMSTLEISPTLVASGATAQGTVTLSGPAPDGGASVGLSSSKTDVASVPASVAVPAGATTATFPVSAKTVASNSSVSISAVYGGVSRSVLITVTPPPPGAGQLSSLTIAPDLVVGGETAQGTATLGAATSIDTEVTLASTDVTVATVPASVTVPAGSTSAVFTVTTLVNNSGVGLFAEISGEAGGVLRSATITTTSAPSGPSLTSVQLFPSTIGGGGPLTGIATFDGTLSDGVLFSYAVSHPDLVTVLNFQGNGPAGDNGVARFWSSNQRAVAVTTSRVSTSTAVTITAKACCGALGEATATLTLTPDAPPPPDRVEVTEARWRPGGRGGTLEVEATSTSATALLSVYIAGTDRFLMVLNPVGGGKYAGQQSFGGGMTNPGSIDVRSNLGGAATSAVRE